MCHLKTKVAGLFILVYFFIAPFSFAASVVPRINLEIQNLSMMPDFLKTQIEVVAYRYCSKGDIGRVERFECYEEKIPFRLVDDRIVTDQYRMQPRLFLSTWGVRLAFYNPLKTKQEPMALFRWTSDGYKDASVIDSAFNPNVAIVFRHIQPQSIAVSLADRQGNPSSIPADFYHLGVGATFADLVSASKMKSISYDRSTNVMSVDEMYLVTPILKNDPASIQMIIYANDGKEDYRYYQSSLSVDIDQYGNVTLPTTAIFKSR